MEGDERLKTERDEARPTPAPAQTSGSMIIRVRHNADTETMESGKGSGSISYRRSVHRGWRTGHQIWRLLRSFRVLLEVVENGLPAGTLHLERVLRFGIEGFDDLRSVTVTVEGDGDPTTIAHGIADVTVMVDVVIGSAEVESHAAVTGFHTAGEGAARPEVVGGSWSMPVVRRGIPPGDMFRTRPAFPDFLDGSVDGGFDGDTRDLAHRKPRRRM